MQTTADKPVKRAQLQKGYKGRYVAFKKDAPQNAAPTEDNSATFEAEVTLVTQDDVFFKIKNLKREVSLNALEAHSSRIELYFN